MSKYTFLSFCNIPDLEDNNQKTVSPLGELSIRAKTYAKFPAVYKNDTSLSLLVTYSGLKDSQYSTMPTDARDRLLTICDWIYTKGDNGSFSNDKAAALQLISSNFTNKTTFATVGDMVTNSKIWLPGHIEGTLTLDSGDTVDFKIWFANDAFLSEYPYCEITVALPLSDDNIDILATGNYQQMATALAAETQDRVEKRINTLTGNTPYTDRLVYPFTVYDTLNGNKSIEVYFYVLANGNSADASDQISQAISDTLLAASKQTQATWEPRIPDLFNPMQFTCIPFWDRQGVENKTSGGSLNSPITDYETALNNAKKYLPNYNNDSLIKSTQFLCSLYKSTNVAYVGALTNRNNTVKISDVFPDVTLIPSTDSETAWMSDATLTFIQSMENLLAGAESLTPDGVPPSGISRVTKDNVLYASMKIGSVTFMVVTRYQFIQDGLITS